MSYQPIMRMDFGLVHGLSWTGLAAPTTPWLRATVSNLLDMLDARLWRYGIADCEIWVGHRHRATRLQQKFAKGGDGSKSHLGGQVPPQLSRVPFNPPVAGVAHTQEEQSSPAEPPARVQLEDSRSHEPAASVTGAELVRRKSSLQKVVVTKFDD
ncbi:hypothetical protein TIFTF001_034338 [Ficus carica]|uniref:Uncharacterized protein n=1 Tax=Ficus carica TaxID=3494 RepID=A0AA88E028_FICCA|nr:hypothetical protein TIFTF001_034338 [Ficus carica]